MVIIFPRYMSSLVSSKFTGNLHYCTRSNNDVISLGCYVLVTFNIDDGFCRKRRVCW